MDVLSANIVVTSFMEGDTWETDRQTLEAKKEGPLEPFDWSLGPSNVMAFLHDVKFSRQITHPITGQKGVIHVAYLIESKEESKIN